MTLKPFGKKILIKKKEQPEMVKKGNLILPSEKKQEYFYEVLDWGVNAFPISLDGWMKVGDTLICLYVGPGIEDGGQIYHFIEDKDILGIVVGDA